LETSIDFESFIVHLKERLKEPLPGEAAQFKMAPLRRPTFKEYYELGRRNPVRSAVLICLYPLNNSVCTVLMLRPSLQGIHSDQVSFPGGRFEEADQDLQTTALREAEEEVGIDQQTVQVLGKLTQVYIPVSNSLVQPFIGFTSRQPDFRKNDLEVKEILETEIRIFLDPAIKGSGSFPTLNDLKIEAPYYNLAGYRIWGATAMMISELTVILMDIFDNQ